MELKEYQLRALKAFDRWHNALKQAREDSEATTARYRAAGLPMPPDIINYPKTAWQGLAERDEVAGRHHIDRQDGAGRPIPHTCFKVPTGGGKTLLAAAALERIQYPTGLVLWIVPRRAIYEQTKDALCYREHPYRQRLERASGGRVKMLEKQNPFNTADIANYLCVMLIMLPAANRFKNEDFLKINQDTGLYNSFFPNSDSALFDSLLLQKHSDLKRAGRDESGPVIQSLTNVIKMLRPVIILDEAHKAYGKKTENAENLCYAINRFNPRLVLEFRHPQQEPQQFAGRYSGLELKDEEMIKLPVQVTSYMRTDWQYTLTQAKEELDRLSNEAQSLQHREGRYIRPIAVVRVERTGNDQRKGLRVHAEDAREYLHQQLGVPAAEIRVKSSYTDELAREDLLSKLSPVRWIITKAALMEGWDCPFAYLLVLLDNTQSQRALTQLVGRVMRQPHARRTAAAALDQCYVYCWNTDVGSAVEQVKNGLEAEGLTGLAGEVTSQEDVAASEQVKILHRREQFKDMPVLLPRVLHRSFDGGWRDLDHLMDIVSAIPWDAVSAPTIQHPNPEAAFMHEATVDLGSADTHFADAQELVIDKTLRLSYFTRRLADIVPNPWRAAQFVMEMFDRLRTEGWDDDHIFDHRANYTEQLRTHLAKEFDRLAEKIYREKIAKGIIQIDSRQEEPNLEVKEQYPISIVSDEPSLQKYGQSVQLSLFEPVFKKQFDSDLEKDFAFHLDAQEDKIKWWHRIMRHRKEDYYLLGWRRQKIYPDFVAMEDSSDDNSQPLIFETKGEHLRNEDTEYKHRVFQILAAAFNDNNAPLRILPWRDRFMIVFKDTFPSFAQLTR